jgi:hypothetical protein
MPPTQPPLTPQNRNDRQEAISGQLDNTMVAVTEQIGNALRGLRDSKPDVMAAVLTNVKSHAV